MKLNNTIYTVLFTLLLSACGGSTTTNDKNTTAVINDKNTTAVINDKNTTTVIDDKNTTTVIDDKNTTTVIDDENTTAQENIAIIYEDAESQNTNKWTITSNSSDKAQVINTYDDEKNSRVIYLDAKIIDNDEYSYDTFRFNGINSSKSNNFIQWRMKFDQRFTISLNIKTKKGERWLKYIEKDTSMGKYSDSIIHGIGSDKTNNQWHTITRDLERDLKRYESDNKFIQINYMTIRGGGYIDNITSYNLEDNLNIDKPVIVSQPGIVLTFDDSYINNWEKIQDTFKEKEAVATFFCNRWANYSENWDITDAEEVILKSFQDNGHEIGFHTVKHLSTRDKKYDDEPNKAQTYFDNQITPGIDNMRNRGFEPTSFSYPYISGQPAHDELIRQELPHIRAFFAHVTLIDDPENISLETIRKHLEKLKKDQDIGVFLSHWIISENTNRTRKYQISKEKLIKIMDMVNELGLKFYTMEEAHNIYMNQ